MLLLIIITIIGAESNIERLLEICSDTGKKEHSVEDIMADLEVLHSWGSMRRKCVCFTYMCSTTNSLKKTWL